VTVRVIAIDGPAGAGKSTVARAVATATGLPFLDTGAMYRCVALRVLRTGTDPADEARVAEAAVECRILLGDGAVSLDGEDVTSAIRSAEVNALVGQVATNSGVREVMRGAQREWAVKAGGGVVEGRDIGTVVFPDADLKVFLTASEPERARRRAEEAGGDLDDVARAIAERDHIDSTRSDSPLRPAEGSVIVDSTGRTVDDVVAEIVTLFGSVGADDGRG
jgi:cytidylate kinase